MARCYACRPPYAPALFAFLLSRVNGRTTALDLGCGPGKIAVVLADHFAEVVARDAAVHMIEAGRNADAGRHANIAWACGRAENLATDRRFDLVTVGTAIHFMDPAILFPKLAALTPTVAILSGDGPATMACGPKTWTEFNRRWVTRMGSVYDKRAFDAMNSRHEPWMDIAGRERFAFRFRQNLEDFITCQHSRATWTRAVMGKTLAGELDRDLAVLLRPYARDGFLELDLVSELVWGAPRTSPRQ
ncbi:MAG TPA: class I SAM-dependent methyltransferase [Caulobacteraceae bacterium]|nr:class I SAM-dependent methyltransferase [Caulobacteraceae bacterium]